MTSAVSSQITVGPVRASRHWLFPTRADIAAENAVKKAAKAKRSQKAIRKIRRKGKRK